MESELIDNEELNCFELQQDGHTAFVRYKKNRDNMALIHTEVPDALAGKGLGTRLAKAVLNHLVSAGLKYKAFCPFIKAYIDKHPAYQPNSIFHTKNES